MVKRPTTRKTIRSFDELRASLNNQPVVHAPMDYSQLDPNKKPTLIFAGFGEVEMDRFVAGDQTEVFNNFMEYRVRQIAAESIKGYLRHGGPAGMSSLMTEIELFENDIRNIYDIVAVSHSPQVYEHLISSTMEMLRAGVYVSLYVFTVREHRSVDWFEPFKVQVATTSDIEAIHRAAEIVSAQPKQPARRDGKYLHTFKNQAMNNATQTTPQSTSATQDTMNNNLNQTTMTDTEASTIANNVNNAAEAPKTDKVGFLDSCAIEIKNKEGDVVQKMVRWEVLAFMLELNFAIVIVSSLLGATLAVVGGWFATALGLAAGSLAFAIVQLSLASAGLVAYMTLGGAQIVAKAITDATLAVHNGVKKAAAWVVGLFSSKEEAEPAAEAVAA